MAEATIQHRWSDESELTVVLEVDSSYPDSIDELRTQVVSMWREALTATVAETRVMDDEAGA